MTDTVREWSKASVDAPDAYYRMAIARLDGSTLTVMNRKRVQAGAYELSEVEWLTADKFRAVSPAGPVVVDKDPRCTCSAHYQRTMKDG